MQRLKELLEAAVAHSTFDLGHTEMRRGEVVISWNVSRPEEVISPDQLRELVLGNSWNDEGINRPRSARLICPKETLSHVENHLQVLFKDYVDPDTNRIGYALPPPWLHAGRRGRPPERMEYAASPRRHRLMYSPKAW